MCFAFNGILTHLEADVHYYNEDRVGTDITFNLQTCPEWPSSVDWTWQHVCINLHSCLSDYDQDGQMFEVERLQFVQGTFWVDEVAIAAGSIEGTVSLYMFTSLNY